MFPEPDLAPYDLTDEWINAVRAKLPELPDQKVARFQESFGLSAYDARTIVENAALATLFEQTMACAGERAQALAKPVVNMLTNEAAAYMNAHAEFDIEQCSLTPQRLTSLVEAVAADEISSKQGKEVLVAIIEEDKDPAAIIDERGMKQVSDTGALEAVVDAVIAENPGQVEKYKSGNTKVIGFFVGQCMKQMKGQGNPKLLNELLAKKLSE